MLAALWLVGQGYSNVKVSFKRASLGKSDYDAIGVKDGHCLVIEVKGADLSDHQLREKIVKFADKVDELRSLLPVLAQALGCESGIEDSSGLFVFLGNLDDFKSPDPSIPLWDYDVFVEALKTADLPNRILDLLYKSYIIHSMWDGDFPHDPFSVGL